MTLRRHSAAGNTNIAVAVRKAGPDGSQQRANVPVTRRQQSPRNVTYGKWLSWAAHLDLSGTRGTTPADATPYAIMLQAAMWHCVSRMGYLRRDGQRPFGKTRHTRLCHGHGVSKR